MFVLGTGGMAAGGGRSSNLSCLIALNGSCRGAWTHLIGEQKNRTGQQNFSLIVNRRLHVLNFLPTTKRRACCSTAEQFEMSAAVSNEDL